MKIIKRNSCISCGSLLQDKRYVRDFPIFMGTTIEPKEDDLKADMIFAECVGCGCIQMRNLIPLDILYKNSHNHSVGKTWQIHHKQFSEFVLKHAKGDVVELGGAHLILAHHLEQSDDINSITVYDTNITGETTSDKIKTVNGLFDFDTVENQVDAVIHSHVIEHLYEPMKQVKDMAKGIKEGGMMIVSAPVIDKMMEDGFTNAMNFEHTYGLTKKLLYWILLNAGLRIVEQHDFSEHCVFVAAIKDGYYPYDLDITDSIRCKNSYFTKFIQEQDAEVERINTLLEGEDSKQTFIFGAHIFTQFLTKNGLSEKLFSCALDNDLKKQGQRLYGTDLFVLSPKVLKCFEQPIVVLKAGQYTEEIKKDILENINSNTRFIL